MKYVTQINLMVVLVTTVFTADFAHAAQSNIGILVFDGFLTNDVTVPIDVFGAASKKSWFSSYDVVVIAATKNKTVTSEGGEVLANKTIDDDLQLDVLIVPSAYEMGTQLKNKKSIAFIAKYEKMASWLASNCSGAGVLDGKKVISWAGGEQDLLTSYPKIDVQFNQNVVVDEKVVTSNGGLVSYQTAFEWLARRRSESLQFNRLDRAFKSPWLKGS